METAILHTYIAYKPDTKEPIIKNSNVSVRAIAELWLQGAQPEEIRLHLPQLTLAQIFDALEYYQDNKKEVDSFISHNSIPANLSATRLS